MQHATLQRYSSSGMSFLFSSNSMATPQVASSASTHSRGMLLSHRISRHHGLIVGRLLVAVQRGSVTAAASSKQHQQTQQKVGLSNSQSAAASSAAASAAVRAQQQPGGGLTATSEGVAAASAVLLEAPAAPPAAAAEVNNTVEDQQPSKGTSRETSTAAAEADAEAAAATPDKEKLSVTTGKDSSDETAAGQRQPTDQDGVTTAPGKDTKQQPAAAVEAAADKSDSSSSQGSSSASGSASSKNSATPPPPAAAAASAAKTLPGLLTRPPLPGPPLAAGTTAAATDGSSKPPDETETPAVHAANFRRDLQQALYNYYGGPSDEAELQTLVSQAVSQLAPADGRNAAPPKRRRSLDTLDKAQRALVAVAARCAVEFLLLEFLSRRRHGSVEKWRLATSTKMLAWLKGDTAACVTGVFVKKVQQLCPGLTQDTMQTGAAISTLLQSPALQKEWTRQFKGPKNAPIYGLVFGSESFVLHLAAILPQCPAARAVLTKHLPELRAHHLLLGAGPAASKPKAPSTSGGSSSTSTQNGSGKADSSSSSSPAASKAAASPAAATAAEGPRARGRPSRAATAAAAAAAADSPSTPETPKNSSAPRITSSSGGSSGGSSGRFSAPAASAGSSPDVIPGLFERQFVVSGVEKLGLAAQLEFVGASLPGMEQLQVLLVDSPSSSAYASMLRHMAAVKLVGADVERSYTNRGQSVPAVLAFMVPGTSQPDPHKGKAWCDTAYLVDLVAAGLVARDGSGATTPQLSQAQLLQGIAGVLGDADMTLVLQDYRADLWALEECGIRSRVLDLQHCWMLLQHAGCKPHTDATAADDAASVSSANSSSSSSSSSGLNSNSRRSLGYLMEQYGLLHPNKQCVVELSLATRGREPAGLWGGARRPLPRQLQTYAASDVRYLPALAMLMARDLANAEPTALLHMLQATLPTHILNRDLGPTLPSVLAMKEDVARGNTMWLPPPAATTTAAASSGSSSSSNDSSSSSSDSSRGLMLPATSQQPIAHLVFKLQMPRPPHSSSSSPDSNSPNDGPQAAAAAYELLVPAAGVDAAKAAARGVGNADDNHKKRPSNSSSSGSIEGLNSSNSSSSSSWRHDRYSLEVLSCLPTRVAELVRVHSTNQVHQLRKLGLGVNTLQHVQLQEVRVLGGGSSVRYCLAADGLPATTNPAAAQGFRKWYEVAVGESGSSQAQQQQQKKDGQRQQEQAWQEWQQQVLRVSGDTASSSTCCVSGSLHTVTPILAYTTGSTGGEHGHQAVSSSSMDNSSSDSISSITGLRFVITRPRPGASLVLADLLARIAATSTTHAQQQQLATGQVDDHELAAWGFNLQPIAATTASTAAISSHPSSSSSRTLRSLLMPPQSQLLLLLGPSSAGAISSTTSSLLLDAAAQLSDGWGCNVAVVGWSCGAGPLSSDFIGSALHLAADSPAGIAAAISDAWQQHNCQVVVCQDAAGSPAVVQAVAAALAAGCSVIAAAATAVSSTTGVSGLTGLRDLAAAAVCNDNGNSSSSQPYVDALATQQQQQCIAAAAAASELWRLLCQHPRRCTVVECQPATHRWHIHHNLHQTLQLLSSNGQPPTPSPIAVNSSPVLPVEVREMQPADGPHSPLAAAAATINSHGYFKQQQSGVAVGQQPVVVLARFSSFDAASAVLAPQLLDCVADLTCVPEI